MRGITQLGLDRMYDWFGVDGEILYDHAWGREIVTMPDIKAYQALYRSEWSYPLPFPYRKGLCHS